eukprot:gene13208-biopygen23028
MPTRSHGSGNIAAAPVAPRLSSRPPRDPIRRRGGGVMDRRAHAALSFLPPPPRVFVSRLVCIVRSRRPQSLSKRQWPCGGSHWTVVAPY